MGRDTGRASLGQAYSRTAASGKQSATRSSMIEVAKDSDQLPPFETADLRANLTIFLNTEFADSTGTSRKIEDYRWGVYAFFDYDREPVYVGKASENLRDCISRHLISQSTEAVAMYVLDPLEVFEIEVWPLPQFQETPGKNVSARKYLNTLERTIRVKAMRDSKFKEVLNQKDPLRGYIGEIPPSFRARIVSDRVSELRSHLDFRIARRSLIISRLAQVISERKVQGGLRRALLTQAKRLQWLAKRRYKAMGGAFSVLQEGEDDH